MENGPAEHCRSESLESDDVGPVVAAEPHCVFPSASVPFQSDSNCDFPVTDKVAASAVNCEQKQNSACESCSGTYIKKHIYQLELRIRNKDKLLDSYMSAICTV